MNSSPLFSNYNAFRSSSMHDYTQCHLDVYTKEFFQSSFEAKWHCVSSLVSLCVQQKKRRFIIDKLKRDKGEM